MTALHRTLLALLAAFCLVAASCSDDDDNGATTPAVTDENGIDDLEAEARTAAIEYFEAYAVLDLDKASGRSSGAARELLHWAADVNEIAEVDGTPYEVTAAPSVEVTVAIESVSEVEDAGVLQATGFIELQQRPPGLAAGTLPSDLDAPPETWYITDVTFTRSGDRLSVDDFRMDDSPYPISELVTDHDGVQATVVLDRRDPGPPTTATTTTTTAAPTTTGDERAPTSLALLDMVRRDLDGSVQYLVIESVDDLALSSATFHEPTDDGSPPDLDAEGQPVDLYQDDADADADADADVDVDADVDIDEEDADADAEADADADVEFDDELDEGARVLAVRPGAFPGSEGTLRLTFTDADEEPVLILDLTIPEPVELEMRPVNEIREAQAPETTTTASTTSTTAPDPTFVPVPVPLPPPPPGAGATSSSTSSTSTTSVTSTTSTTLP